MAATLRQPYPSTQSATRTYQCTPLACACKQQVLCSDERACRMETRIKSGAECTLAASRRRSKVGGGRTLGGAPNAPPFLEECSCKCLVHEQALLFLRWLDPPTRNKVLLSLSTERAREARHLRSWASPCASGGWGVCKGQPKHT